MHEINEFKPPLSNIDLNNDSLVRIDISNKDHIEDFLLNKTPLAIPQLFLPALLSNKEALERYVFEQYRNIFKILKNNNVEKISICADDDGALQVLLSPRANELDLAKRTSLLFSIFKEASDKFIDVWVSLCVEELSPNGLDATDGIEIAKGLEAKGLKNLIVNCGTRHFMPLFDRRITKEKSSELIIEEPGMASALWIKDRLTLNVWAIVNDDLCEARKIAKKCNIFGLVIKKSM